MKTKTITKYSIEIDGIELRKNGELLFFKSIEDAKNKAFEMKPKHEVQIRENIFYK